MKQASLLLFDKEIKKFTITHFSFNKKFAIVHFSCILKDMNNNTFWGRVKTLMRAHNITQSQFAEFLGISLHTFKAWMHYKRIPDTVAAYKIAYALGVTLDYLISGKNRDIAAMRSREIEARKASVRIQGLLDQINEELRFLRPLPVKKTKKNIGYWQE